MLVSSSSIRRNKIRLVTITYLCIWIQGIVVEASLLGNFLKGRCRLQLSEPCGFLLLGSVIRYGEQGADDCAEKCAYFLIMADRGYACGSCEIPPTQPPVIETPSPFNIYSDLLDIPIEDRAYFRKASETWTNIIRSELSNVTSRTLNGTTPLDGKCVYPTIIDDLYICFQYADIDGVGKIVARTTVLAYRNTDGLPISARIRVDNADLSSLKTEGIFQDAIEHEIAHALGFGILWNNKGLVRRVTNTTCTYTGKIATAEFTTLTGCTQIPNTCGHWDEYCMGREIMTSVVDVTNVISRVTIASMEDLGYEVNYGDAEPYSDVEINILCLIGCKTRRLSGVNDTSKVNDPLNITSISASRQRRRPLSDEGYAHVVQHGLDVLAQETNTSTNEPKNHTMYILYKEENELYSVPVHLQS
jgi:Leishmanolysin